MVIYTCNAYENRNKGTSSLQMRLISGVNDEERVVEEYETHRIYKGQRDRREILK